MKVLVAYAVDPEFTPWRRLRKFQEIAAGDFAIQRTEIGRATVDFVVSGMGPAHAARAMAAVDLGAYAVCIASGFAGSLRPELGVGDIVIPRGVRSDGAGELVSCDAGLVNEAASGGGKAIEVMVSSARVASSVAEKNERVLSRLGVRQRPR